MKKSVQEILDQWLAHNRCEVGGNGANHYSAWIDFPLNEEIQVNFSLQERRDFTPVDAMRFQEIYTAVCSQEDRFRDAIVEKFLPRYNEKQCQGAPVTDEGFKHYIALADITLNEKGPFILGYSIDEPCDYFRECIIHVITDADMEIQGIEIIA